MAGSMKIFFIFFGIVCLIFGIVFLSSGILGIQKVLETQNWEETQGTILSSRIEQRTETDYDPDDHTRTTTTIYTAKIEYEYTINGQRYTSHTISASYVSTSSSSDAQNLINKYPQGKNVIVYYNPDNFNEAVLETGLTGANYIMAIAGLLPLIVGIIMLYFAFRRKKSKGLQINVEKYTYQPGEEIKGNINITLKKPNFSNSLKVTLVGKRELNAIAGSGSRFFCPILDIEKIIETEKEFFDESYYFSIKIPDDALIKAETCTEDVIGFVGNKPIRRKSKYNDDPTQKNIISSGFIPGRNIWYIEAELDVDRGRNIKNTISIVVSKSGHKNTYL